METSFGTFVYISFSYNNISVTATEYIYESASEDEKEVVKNGSEKKPQVLTEKKNNKPEPEKTTTTKGKNKKPVGGKQPTLMSFFKKN